MHVYIIPLVWELKLCLRFSVAKVSRNKGQNLTTIAATDCKADSPKCLSQLIPRNGVVKLIKNIPLVCHTLYISCLLGSLVLLVKRLEMLFKYILT